MQQEWRAVACVLACVAAMAWGGAAVAGEQAHAKAGVMDKAPAKAESKPFDMNELIERLKNTDAIGFLTKLTLRSDALDLVDMIKAYKLHDSPFSLAELHAKFDGLLLKVLALLTDDPGLSRDISMAREEIWMSLMEVKA